MPKRSILHYQEYGDFKRHCFEVPHGQKREREDEMMGETTNKRQFTERQHMENQMALLQAENQRLRSAMEERDRMINYGSDEIRRLNADMFTIKQQMLIMHNYCANLEGRAPVVDLTVVAY